MPAAGRGPAGQPPASIVTSRPELDWRGWIGLRKVLTHGYHRRDPPVIWRAAGELQALVQACSTPPLGRKPRS